MRAVSVRFLLNLTFSFALLVQSSQVFANKDCEDGVDPSSPVTGDQIVIQKKRSIYIPQRIADQPSYKPRVIQDILYHVVDQSLSHRTVRLLGDITHNYFSKTELVFANGETVLGGELLINYCKYRGVNLAAISWPSQPELLCKRYVLLEFVRAKNLDMFKKATSGKRIIEFLRKGDEQKILKIPTRLFAEKSKLGLSDLTNILDFIVDKQFKSNPARFLQKHHKLLDSQYEVAPLQYRSGLEIVAAYLKNEGIVLGVYDEEIQGTNETEQQIITALLERIYKTE